MRSPSAPEKTDRNQRTGSPRNSPRYQAEHFLSALARGPEWLLYDFSPSAGLFQFVRMSEQDYRRSLFLDPRMEAADREELWTPVPFAAAPHREPGAPLGLLFHTSFCGSTLFANLFFGSGGAFVVREPPILTRIGRMVQDGELSESSARLLIHWALTCLRRPFEGYRCTLIKPSNLVYPVAATIMEETPGARAVVLHQPLASFLVSCLKKTPATQQRLPELAGAAVAQSPWQRAYINFLSSSPDPVLSSATVLWDAHFRSYARLLDEHPASTTALDFDQAVLDLEQAGRNLAQFLFPDLPGLAESLDRSALDRNAKEPSKPYSVQQRKAERSLVETHYRKRLTLARRAADGLFRAIGQPQLSAGPPKSSLPA